MKLDRDEFFNLYLDLYGDLLLLMERMYLEESVTSVAQFLEIEHGILVHISAMHKLNQQLAELNMKPFKTVFIKSNLHEC